jgi:hypothetical protein
VNKLLVISFVFLVSACPVSDAQEQPPANYENWGVCPFECCEYRGWTASADIPVHESRSDKSAVVFHLQKQEKLRALTGVVVTEKAGVVRLNKAVQDGYVKGVDRPQLTFKSTCFRPWEKVSSFFGIGAKCTQAESSSQRCPV